MFRPMFLCDTDPDSGTGGTGTPGDAPGNGDQNADPVKKPGTDWEAAYKGLQRLQQRTKKELDERREKFEKFRKSLEKSGKQRVKDALDGEGPGPVGDDNSRDPGKKRSVDEVYNELVALGGTKTPEGRAKYDKVMEERIG